MGIRLTIILVMVLGIAACSGNKEQQTDADIAQLPDISADESVDESADADAPKAAGRACLCNENCAGNGLNTGVCLMGICVQRASADCASVDACPAGLTCRAVPGIDEGTVCFAGFTDEFCDGYPSSGGLCQPKGAVTCGDCVAACEPFKCKSPAAQTGLSFDEAVTAETATLFSEAFDKCAGTDRYYKITIQPGKMAVFGISLFSFMGDLDILVYNSKRELVAWRKWDGVQWPAEGQTIETNEEFFSALAYETPEIIYLRVTAKETSTENHAEFLAYQTEYRDGKNCIDAGFTAKECEQVLPFPLHIGATDYDNYIFDTDGNYRFGMRRLIMAARYAISRVTKAFPGTMPVGINDVSQIDGLTPGSDGRSLRHRSADHRIGSAIDIAYYQNGPDNRFRAVCPFTWFLCACNEGTSASEVTVDRERQVYFMAQLMETGAVDGVLLTDKVILPLLDETKKALCALPAADPKAISSKTCASFDDMVSDSVSCHYHHIHMGTVLPEN